MTTSHHILAGLATIALASTLAGCGTTAPTGVAKPSTLAATSKTTATPSATPATNKPAPPAPNNPSTLEGGGVSTKLLIQQIGKGSGDSKSFTPTGSVAPSQSGPGSDGMVRLRVEWACAPGSAVTDVHLADASGDISGSMTNGFDGPVPVSNPPAKVIWTVQGSCGWHVRALDQ